MGNQLEVPAADEKKTEKSKEKVYDDFLCFMNSIPVEILCMILKYLGPAELFCCRLVCKFWNQLLENESDRLWKRFCSPNWIISSSKNENNKYERCYAKWAGKQIEMKKKGYVLSWMNNNELENTSRLFSRIPLHSLSIRQRGILGNNDASYDVLFIVCLVGDEEVGKSSFLKCLIHSRIKKDDKYRPTIGVEFGQSRILDLNTTTTKSRTCRLQMWDLAGGPRFKEIVSAYYRGAMGFCIFFDLTNRESFENCFLRWLPDIEKHNHLFIRDSDNDNNNNNNNDLTSKIVPIVLVGTKLDLVEEDQRRRVVDKSEAIQKCVQYKLSSYVEVSSVTGNGVEECIHHFANVIQWIDNSKRNENNSYMESSILEPAAQFPNLRLFNWIASTSSVQEQQKQKLNFSFSHIWSRISNSEKQ